MTRNGGATGKGARNESQESMSTHARGEGSGSPYFLSNGYSLRLVLLSHPLVGENYHIWSRSMYIALVAENKLCFFVDTLRKPNSTDLLYQ